MLTWLFITLSSQTLLKKTSITEAHVCLRPGTHVFSSMCSSKKSRCCLFAYHHLDFFQLIMPLKFLKRLTANFITELVNLVIFLVLLPRMSSFLKDYIGVFYYWCQFGSVQMYGHFLAILWLHIFKTFKLRKYLSVLYCNS